MGIRFCECMQGDEVGVEHRVGAKRKNRPCMVDFS